jgi:hypothetical protein
MPTLGRNPSRSSIFCNLKYLVSFFHIFDAIERRILKTSAMFGKVRI